MPLTDNLPAEFDKRTSLGISKTFNRDIQSERLLTGRVAKDICAQVTDNVVAIVPQIDNYLCPVCFELAYRPVRLDCKHVFCIRCVVKIQRREEKQCPLCRADVVLNTSGGVYPEWAMESWLTRRLENVDYKLGKYLKKYFPREVKEKQRANDIERGIEDYGPNYKHQECIVM